MQQVILATANPGKVAELATLLAEINLQLIAQSDLGIDSVAETGLTFVENAILKARYASQISGLPTIADDSGLVVDILQGAPGIFSARYAGEASDNEKNCAKLLAELAGVPQVQRRAHFYCTLVYLHHAADPAPIICQGSWQGRIALQPSGNGGFGYDPLFLLPDLRLTAAELTAEQKNTLSHRGQAVRKLVCALKNHYRS